MARAFVRFVRTPVLVWLLSQAARIFVRSAAGGPSKNKAALGPA